MAGGLQEHKHEVLECICRFQITPWICLLSALQCREKQKYFTLKNIHELDLTENSTYKHERAPYQGAIQNADAVIVL